MSWSIREVRGVLVATIGVECLDAARISLIRDRGRAVLAESMPLVLDLSAVAFADSSGLGWICSMHEEMGAHRLVVVGAGRRLDALLDRLPRHRRPRFFEDIEDAVQRLGDGDPLVRQAREFERAMFDLASTRTDPAHA